MDWFDVASSGEDGKRVEGTTVTLLLTDAETGYVAAIPSPSKGQEMFSHLAKMVITFLKLMRHEKLKIRSDQEPALKALIGMVKEKWPHRILVEESPLYSSQSNGRAERAIQTVRRLAASIRMAVELRIGMAFDSGMIVWPWLIRHTAWLHNRFHVKYNGRTCYEELYQTRYKNEVVAFGKSVLFMEPYPASRSKAKGVRKWTQVWSQAFGLAERKNLTSISLVRRGASNGVGPSEDERSQVSGMNGFLLKSRESPGT